MSTRKVYLDHNATTPLHPEVKKKMKEAMDVYGNPSSMHNFGRQARKYIEEAREEVASFINADRDEIVFVGSGSEANNTVLSLINCPWRACNMDSFDRPEIITSEIEHPCIRETAKCIDDSAAKVHYIPVKSNGKIDIEALKEKLSENTLIVSIMMANNEIGTIQDIKEISEIVHQYDTLFHTDAVQAVGKIPVDVKELNVDFLSMSAHKVYGPKGVGGLYIKDGTPFCPLIRGGHQEQGRRAGTENTIGIAGFGKAIEMRKKEMEEEEERLLVLKKKLKAGLKNRIDQLKFIGHEEDCLPGTLNVSFPGIEGESILLYLDMQGVAVSTGSACASGSLDPSHVILATGLAEEYTHGSIRISMGRRTTEEDIEYTLDAFEQTINKLKQMTTYTDGIRS